GSYTDAHLSKNAPGLGALEGQSLAYVPKWSNTLNIDYQWQIADGYSAFIGGTVQFVGTRFSDFSSSAIDDPHAKLPAYQTVALQAGFKTGPYTFEAYAKNLGNSHGISSYVGDNGFNNTGLATLITPRVIGVRLAFDY